MSKVIAENPFKDIYKRKSLISEIQDVDVANGIVTGYFSSFNNIDNDNEMIVQGAFTKTILERGANGKNKILHLLGHDSSKVLGKPTVLKEDAKGLYFETKIVPTTIGKDTLLLYAAGVYNEHSIGYRVIKWERVPEQGRQDVTDYYKLLELYLYEGSTVAFGANEETPFTGLKSLTKESKLEFLNSKMNKLFKALKVGELTDETLAAIEIEFKQIQQNINDLLSLKEEQQPIIEITETTRKPKAINYNFLNNNL